MGLKIPCLLQVSIGCEGRGVGEGLLLEMVDDCELGSKGGEVGGEKGPGVGVA